MGDLHTIVDNIGARVVAMEKLAVTDVGTRAYKYWLYVSQFFPYFINRISGLVEVEGRNNMWILGIEARLVVSHISQVAVAPTGVENPQEESWGYIPAMIQYFRTYNQLKPPTLAEVTYLHPDGVSIGCENGMEDFVDENRTHIMFASFDIVVPILILD